MTLVCAEKSPASFLLVLRGAKWGAKLHTHQRTATDTSGTQPLKSRRGIWTVTNTDGRFRDALQAGGQGFDSPQLHSGGLVEFGGFSRRNRPGFCRSRSDVLELRRRLSGEGGGTRHWVGRSSSRRCHDRRRSRRWRSRCGCWRSRCGCCGDGLPLRVQGVGAGVRQRIRVVPGVTRASAVSGSVPTRKRVTVTSWFGGRHRHIRRRITRLITRLTRPTPRVVLNPTVLICHCAYNVSVPEFGNVYVSSPHSSCLSRQQPCSNP